MSCQGQRARTPKEYARAKEMIESGQYESAQWLCEEELQKIHEAECESHMTTTEERELAKKFEASYLKGLLPDVRVIYLAGIRKGRELEREEMKKVIKIK